MNSILYAAPALGAVLVLAAAIGITAADAQQTAPTVAVSCSPCMAHEPLTVTFNHTETSHSAYLEVYHHDRTTSPIEEGKLQYDDVYTYTFIPDHEYSWATRGGEGTYTVKINHDDTYYYSEPFVIHALNEAQELNRLADIADITEEHLAKQNSLLRAIVTALQAQTTVMNSTDQHYSSGYANGRAAGFQEGLVACGSQ